MEQTIGKRIAHHRKALGLTQDALAEKLGVTAQAVSKWENDQSCPDISMLPRLAEIFGVTTDALLGVEPPAEKPAPREEGLTAGANWEMELDRSPLGRIGVAVWILLTGDILLASNYFGSGVKLWDVLWPSALLIFGLLGLYPKFSGLRLGCALFGGGFLLNNLNLLPLPGGKQMVLPACLILLGLCLFLDSLKKPGFREVRIQGKGTAGKNYYKEEKGRFESMTSFAEHHHKVDLTRLTSGEVRVNFGESVVDLTSCKEIGENCSLEAYCSFGELTLLAPRTCRVEADVHTGFGAFSVDGEPEPHAQTTIRLKGNVSFGQLLIRYV